jgi:hypothetical protein
MSHGFSPAKNKQHKKHPKVHFQQYLSNAREPADERSHYSAPELEAELLENGYDMKRRFRHLAKTWRHNHW